MSSRPPAAPTISRTTAAAFRKITARFVNGVFSTVFGRTTNIFDTSRSSTSVQLSSVDQTVETNDDNVIYGGTGDNTLWGGDSGDDTLFGGTGSNEYIYGAGNGANDGDVVKLLNISLDDINLKYTEIDNDKVTISMHDGGALTLNGKADVTFEIGDGSSWTVDRDKKRFNRK